MDSNRRGGGNGSIARAGDFLMTGIRKRRVAGSKTSAGGLAHRRALFKRLKATLGFADQRLYTSKQFQEGSNKYEEFFCYNENDEEDLDSNDSREPRGTVHSVSKGFKTSLSLSHSGGPLAT